MSDREINLPEISNGDLSALLHSGEGTISPFSKEIYIGRQSIVGIRFQEGAVELVKNLKPGDRVSFLREPNNEYDEHAIMAVDGIGRKLGYIPRRENLVMSALLDRGKVFYGVIPDGVQEEYVRIREYPEQMMETEIGIPVTITVDLYMREFSISGDITTIPQHGSAALDKSIDNYPMSDGTRTVLRLNNILTLRELSRCSMTEVKRFKLINHNCMVEMQALLEEVKSSFRPSRKRKLFYGYPSKIQEIARQKKDYWEHHLLFESIIVYYEWLLDAREQRAMFCWNDSGLMSISDFQQFKDLIIGKVDEMQDILLEVDLLFKDRLIEAVGAPGEPGDAALIIKLSEDIANVFKKIMLWRHSFKYINVPDLYREAMEMAAGWAENILKEYDSLYQQCKNAVTQIEACLSGTLDSKDLEIRVAIRPTFDNEQVQKVIKRLGEKIRIESFNSQIKSKNQADTVDKLNRNNSIGESEMATIYDIKDNLETIYTILDKIENETEMPEELENTRLKDLFKMELLSYFMYLASSDGKITASEKDFMNTLFDVNMSVQEYVKFINDNNIYSVDFEERIPVTLRFAVAFDAKMQILTALIDKHLDAFTPKLIHFYLDAGKAFIGCDRDVDSQEVEDIKIYIGKLADSASSLLSDFVDSLKNSDKKENDSDIGYIGSKKRENSKSTSNISTSTYRKSTVYGESVYKVGTDIPAGKYKLFVDQGRAYYAICKDPNCDEIITNDNFYKQAYISIKNGQFLDLRRCTAVPLDEAAMFDGTVYTSGEYLVGEEIPAGEYRLQADSGTRGYYALVTLANDGSRKINSNGIITNAAYIQTRNGQILVLSRCTLRR